MRRPSVAQGLHQGGLFARLNEAVRSREVVVTDHPLEVGEIVALGLNNAVETLKTSRFAFVIVPLLDRNQVPFGLLVLNKAIMDQAGTVDDRRPADPADPRGQRQCQRRHPEQAVAGGATQADRFLDQAGGRRDRREIAYTGGHCQRVPALTRLLAEAAVGQTEGPYRDFSLTDEEWEALDIAAWLHDCGKVTTPEYVVDKATKLETIYDRIHEVRMRFEVLKRDAEIAYWRGRAEGGDEAILRQAMDAAKRALDDDFAFVARSNEGGEFMEPEKIARIKAIAARHWTRTISNRLGVSYEEGARMKRQPEPPLPVEEPLLSDRDDHISELTDRDVIAPDNKWGFALTVPKFKFNRGEVYNLCVARGTLTEEERYRINDHIVQTIIMLESLPFPKHLKNVRNWPAVIMRRWTAPDTRSGCAAATCPRWPASWPSPTCSRRSQPPTALQEGEEAQRGGEDHGLHEEGQPPRSGTARPVPDLRCLARICPALSGIRPDRRAGYRGGARDQADGGDASP